LLSFGALIRSVKVFADDPLTRPYERTGALAVRED